MIAKPVVKNKFWIVERDGEKVGTLQKNTKGVAFVEQGTREQFANIDLVKNHYNIHFDRPSAKSSKKDECSVYGYPAEVRPHNSVWDIKHRVPLYTKTKKSRCYYAAGWYALDQQIVFCPKYIFINRNSFMGPFNSELEAKNANVKTSSINTQSE